MLLYKHMGIDYEVRLSWSTWNKYLSGDNIKEGMEEAPLHSSTNQMK